jgi:hypothetical protein
MKYLLTILAFTFVFSQVNAQKTLKVKNRQNLYELIEASKIDLETKNRFKQTLGVEDGDDDCTPPPCSGLIDPWTCECYSDLKDPWEEDKIAARMKSFLSLESMLLKGKGKDIVTPEMVKKARSQYPGKSLKAITNRINFYTGSVK